MVRRGKATSSRFAGSHPSLDRGQGPAWHQCVAQAGANLPQIQCWEHPRGCPGPAACSWGGRALQGHQTLGPAQACSEVEKTSRMVLPISWEPASFIR